MRFGHFFIVHLVSLMLDFLKRPLLFISGSPAPSGVSRFRNRTSKTKTKNKKL